MTIVPFKKTVCPGKVKCWTRNGSETLRSVFVTIELREARGDEPPELSITSVEGPLSNGDALGSCGQARDLDVAVYATGWNKARVDKLRDLWERWHLNCMNAADAAMRADGWVEKAATVMHGYKFTLTRTALEASSDAKARAVACLKEGATFTPTQAETEAATRPGEIVLWVRADDPEPRPPSAHYKRKRDLWGHNKGNLAHPEQRTLGQLYPKDHPDGLLGKKHSESGNGYGSAWYAEAVPDDVLQWLLDLPEDNRLPGAWAR